MKIALATLLAANPTPTTDPANTWYSPDLIGFLGTFILVIGALLIIWDMVRRIRRVRYRAEIQAKLEAEEAKAQAKRAARPTGETAGGNSGGSKPARPAPPKKPKRD